MTAVLFTSDGAALQIRKPQGFIQLKDNDREDGVREQVLCNTLTMELQQLDTTKAPTPKRIHPPNNSFSEYRTCFEIHMFDWNNQRFKTATIPTKH